MLENVNFSGECVHWGDGGSGLILDLHFSYRLLGVVSKGLKLLFHESFADFNYLSV